MIHNYFQHAMNINNVVVCIIKKCQMCPEKYSKFHNIKKYVMTVRRQKKYFT